MKDTTLSKLGGACSIVSGVTLIVIALLLLLSPPDQQIDPYTCRSDCADKFLTSLAHTSTLHIVGLGLLALHALLAIAAVLAISASVRSVNDGWARWTSTLAIIGLAVNAIGPLRRVALDPTSAVAYVQGDAAVKAALTAPGAFLGLDPQGWLKFGAFGFWVLVVSLLALRGGAWPKPLAFVGIGVALASWLVVVGEVTQTQSQSLLAILAGGGGVAQARSEGGEPMLAWLATNYPWLVFAHVASVFAFLLAHGVSTGVLFKLRAERKVERIRALLDLSKRSIVWTYAFLVLIGLTGFAAAYIGDWWRQGWVWASAGLLILISLAMGWIGDPYYDRLRVAVGLAEPKGSKGKKDAPTRQGSAPDPSEGEEQLDQLLRSPRPLLLALVGIVGLAAILWLMLLKPF
jgi:hypothetical protein